MLANSEIAITNFGLVHDAGQHRHPPDSWSEDHKEARSDARDAAKPDRAVVKRNGNDQRWMNEALG